MLVIKKNINIKKRKLEFAKITGFLKTFEIYNDTII